MSQHACHLGWFSDSESQELIALADEIRTCFGSSGSTSPGIKSPGSTFSQIMERFYPFVKLGHVLVSFEVKAGYTMLAHDFYISKNMPHSLQEKIVCVAHLLVIRYLSLDLSIINSTFICAIRWKM
jgi:E3 SUMO-protein ligase PIAS1